jgi:polygalacturonase
VDSADKAQFENVRLIGFQDTLYLKSPQIGSTSRSFFNKSYIEGDVDFIFGDSTAYFYQSEIRTLGDRACPTWPHRIPTSTPATALYSTTCASRMKGKPAPITSTAASMVPQRTLQPYAPLAVEGYSCTYGPATAIRRRPAPSPHLASRRQNGGAEFAHRTHINKQHAVGRLEQERHDLVSARPVQLGRPLEQSD